jgi:hypothetical protein
LAGEDRLLADVHEDEQIWIGQYVNRPIDTAKGAVGLGQEHLQLPGDLGVVKLGG